MEKLLVFIFATLIANNALAQEVATNQNSNPKNIIQQVTSQLDKSKTDLSSFLEEQKIPSKLEENLLKLDVSFDQGIADVNLIDGINLSSKYHYDVNASYQDKFYTRIDKYDLNANINPGTLLKDVMVLPFSFGITRNTSFLFVRQFPSKAKALKAMPYGPQKVPLNANHALALDVGDFVSIPANLNYAFSVNASTASLPAPIVVSANASTFIVLSGEFTIQVFKLDESHVRVKLISNRGLSGGGNSSVSFGLSAFGFRFFGEQKVDSILNDNVHRIAEGLVDRDLFQLGLNYSPGANFISDYVFDLSDTEAQAAYNQILSSAYKLKDIGVTDRILSAKNLQDRLITTTDLADKMFDRDINVPDKQKKVLRIFKGFNNSISVANHFKIAFLLASYVNNTTYTENKLTFKDRNENTLEFFYPTLSKYWETNFGSGIFNLNDQSNKTFFGLIPRKNNENVDLKDPDIGILFERKDKLFAPFAQKNVERFMIDQLPPIITKGLNLDQWKNGEKKIDSRIFFQLVLKSQGFNYLRSYSQLELSTKLIEYSKSKKQIHLITRNTETNPITSNGSNQLSGDFVESFQIDTVSALLYHALHDAENVSENTLAKIIRLNEIPLFDQIGIGFLISLLPEENLNHLIYIKLEMIAKDVDSVKTEYGKLNYRMLYNEINTVQSRLSNRSYDLRLTPEDIQIENTDSQSLDNDGTISN